MHTRIAALAAALVTAAPLVLTATATAPAALRRPIQSRRRGSR